MLSRRSFTATVLQSLATYGLIETSFHQQLFARDVQPEIERWMIDLHNLSQDVKTQKLKDTVFQVKLEELYRRVNLPELIKFLELDRMTANMKLPDNGAKSLGIDFSKVEGLPKRLVFGRQIFALKKDRSVVPHGHDNMCTGFIILRGTFAGKHYDRLEDHADHYLMKPTIDRVFKPGETSTISDHKDNVHWFKCQSDTGFIFNVHIMGYNPENPKVGNRVYVDPDGERTAGGLIVAKKISSSECHKKYG